MRALAILFLLLWSHEAWAQPGIAPVGQPGSYAPQHAVPPLPYELRAPTQSLPPPQAQIAEEPADPMAGTIIDRPGYRALLHDDGRMLFDADYLHTGLANDPVGGPRAFATFDIGDAILRLAGKDQSSDPYFSDKMGLLEATWNRRVEMRAAHARLTMDRALVALPEYLAMIWDQPSWDDSTKRRIFFALWDEAAEGGNELLREGGAQARQIIETFIRTRLPAAGARGYVALELEELNAIRQSRAVFAPYSGSSSWASPALVQRLE